MELEEQPILIEALAPGDRERCRWYAEGATGALVLTLKGELVEPCPTFGPRCYLVIAHRATARDAARYARERGYLHPRLVARS
jgi:hypothetical protein